MKQKDYLAITDLQSVERMLTTVEVEYNEENWDGLLVVTTENGVVFEFTDNGELKALYAEP